MLIIEGPDGVGKTALCKKLLAALPTHIYAHFTRLPPGFDYYWGYADRMSRNVVQDRFHMSEVAYAVARGERPGIDEETYRLIDARLRILGACTVLITASQALLADRWHEGQMYDLERILAAGRAFDQFYEGRRVGGVEGVDMDFHVHCTETSPWVTDGAVTAILDGYLARRKAVDMVARRWWPALDSLPLTIR